MKRVKVSNNVIRRLPRYLRKLDELKASGVGRISSFNLGQQLGLTPSQIRQDFSCFGEFGQQGYGYNVKYLYEEIAKILGLHKQHNLILIGAGHLGQALANYVNFERRGFVLKGIFDIDTAIHGQKIRGIEIRPMEEIESFMRDHAIDIAVLTIPKAEAVKIADELVSFGIKAIWNFAHVDLDVPEDTVVENVHLSESLMRLSYNLANSSVTD